MQCMCIIHIVYVLSHLQHLVLELEELLEGAEAQGILGQAVLDGVQVGAGAEPLELSGGLGQGGLVGVHHPVLQLPGQGQ